jgi:hypothetical protein
MRVLVDVTPEGLEYAVVVRFDGDAEAIAERTMPDPGSPSAKSEVELLNRIEDERLQGCSLGDGDVACLGQYLFGLLFSQECWDTILREARVRGDRSIEIALRWDSGETKLHRQSWEAMHDGTRFLGENPDFSIAVTRVVTDAVVAGPPTSVAAPARVLFVVGVALNDPSIRRGAEIVGLLRGLESEDSSIHSKIIESVTLEQLEEACAAFQPHIVHFVGHGQFRERGELQLSVEEIGQSGWIDGERLVRAMTTGGSSPTIVLLTGCESAVAGDHMDSLASELVRRGVPIAIGMAGRISDSVCRLFTRRLGMSFGRGEPLVEAMTHGRRAGLQSTGGSAANDRAWAMPSIYLAPSVPEHYVPIGVGGTSVLDRVARFGIDRRPVFCGRARLGGEFERLLRPQGLSVLVAYAENGDKLGKTRLQHEFASRALMAGHVVVMIDDYDDERSNLPQNSIQLAAILVKSIGRTRAAFGLPGLFESSLLCELEGSIHPLDLDSVKDSLRPGRVEDFLAEAEQMTESGGVLDNRLAGAFRADLTLLLDDVRTLDEEAAGRRPVLVFGGLGDWGDALALLFKQLVGRTDPAVHKEPFSLFATCSLKEEDGAHLEELRDDADGRTWEEWISLGSFTEHDHEDTLAYQWVLLHPWSRHEDGKVVYVPNPAEGDQWVGVFRKYFHGIPGEFGDVLFYTIAAVLHRTEWFIAGTDEQILEQYKEL